MRLILSRTSGAASSASRVTNFDAIYFETPSAEVEREVINAADGADGFFDALGDLGSDFSSGALQDSGDKFR